MRARLRRLNYDRTLALLQFGDLTTLRFADITLDQKKRECYGKHARIRLTTKEFDLLRYFMQYPRMVLTRQQIFEYVWGYTFAGETNIVEVLIYSLRRKLKTETENCSIQTIRGVGYVLKEFNFDYQQRFQELDKFSLSS